MSADPRIFAAYRDFAQNDELINAEDQAHTYGVAAVQNIDQFGLELFIAGRDETFTRAFASYHPIEAVMTVHVTISGLPGSTLTAPSGRADSGGVSARVGFKR